MSTSESPLHLVVKTPVDLIAVAHVCLGFVPEESLVITAVGGRQFHCRLDIPPPSRRTADLEDLARLARGHHADAITAVIFSKFRPGAAGLATAVCEAFGADGIEVFQVVFADGERWSLPLFRDSVPQPYDVSIHPIVLDALLAGFSVLESRAALAKRVAPDPKLRAAVAAVLCEAASTAQLPTPLDEAQGSTHGATSARQIAAAILDCEDEGPNEWGVRSSEEQGGLDWWCTVTRGAPLGRAAEPAARAALLAWRAGNGALAWCAVDRCLAEEPDHGLGRTVALLLESATAPPPR